MVGWFSLGHSPSGMEEERHWQELCERQGTEQVGRLLYRYRSIKISLNLNSVQRRHVVIFIKRIKLKEKITYLPI